MKKNMLLILSVFCLTALSDATVIYKEIFNGPSSSMLNGRAPFVGPAGVVWSAGANIAADGTIVNNGADFSGDTAFLPFVPQSGKVYELLVHVNATTGDWLAAGFTEFMNTGGGTTSVRFIDGTDCVFWALVRSSLSSAFDQTFLGVRTNGGSNGTTSQAKKIRITLDTRNPQYEVKWYLNDILQRTASSLSPAAYPINYVAFGNNKCNGKVSFFRFSILDCATEPEPANFASLTSTDQLSFTVPTGTSKYDVWFAKADANELDYKSRLSKISTVTGVNPAERQTVDIPAGQIPLTSGVHTWVVDSYIGSLSYPDPNGPGFAWQFDITTIPVFVLHPENQIKFMEDSASFSVTVDSDSPVTYTWYRSPDFANNTDPDVQIQVGPDATLDLTDISGVDEAYYYCKAVNDSGEAYAVKSNPAYLGVKRQVAHWTLDSKAGGIYEDSSPEGHDAVITGDPTLVDGVDPAKTQQAVIINTSSGYALAGTWNPSYITKAVTLSMWVKWDGVIAGVDQNLMCKASTLDSNDMLWRLYLPAGTSQLQFGRPGTLPDYVISSVPLTPGEWQYVAVSYDSGNVVFYSVENDEKEITIDTGVFLAGFNANSNFWIGALGATGGTATSPFLGSVDEIQVFNYALDAQGIVSLYNEVFERGFCVLLSDDARAADLNGDCVVNLADFAEVASDWMKCGLYPESGCDL